MKARSHPRCVGFLAVTYCLRCVSVLQVADSQLKKDKQVLKDMECETDEEAGFKPKDFSNFIR